MAKYIITVQDTTQENLLDDKALGQEIFKLGIDEFDPLQFCAALKAKARGRKPGKGAKEAT